MGTLGLFLEVTHSQLANVDGAPTKHCGGLLRIPWVRELIFFFHYVTAIWGFLKQSDVYLSLVSSMELSMCPLPENPNEGTHR